MTRTTLIGLALTAVLLSVVRGDDFPEVRDSDSERELRPMPADEAARTMRVPAGFRVSVFAAEPEVRNPIAMAWDDRGRLWVAENYTYSDRTQRFDWTLRDRVLVFEDRDHDGRSDVRTVFTEDVQMLTSVEVGRGGVWLMCPPRLLFLPDVDGDAVPDGPARAVLDGFEVAQDNYHNFANGLRWGPDGWLYGRCGHSCPGRIGVPGTPDEQRIPLDGGIWRFHPERRVFEVLCHGTVNPWGHDWDRNGELFFINTVIGHVWHVMPGAHFKESFGESMNRAVYARLDTIADHYHFDTRGNGSDGRDGAADKLGGGHAHIGMMIYQQGDWPERYHDRLFTLNMHGRRANVERLERHGAGYVARHEPDWLLSADPFFRGLEISVGPDGNVFVLDWSDTGECHEHNGVHRTSGRIYKISYGEPHPPEGKIPKPLCLGGSGKLPELWRRYQAGECTPETLLALLADPDEHVRAWAIRLLTDFWPLDTIVGPRAGAVYPDEPVTRAQLVRLAKEDPSGIVHLVLASTLQRLPVRQRAELAGELVKHERYADDRDLPLLVWFGLIPVGDHDPRALLRLVSGSRLPATTRCLARNVAERVESDPKLLDELLQVTLPLERPLQQAALSGIEEAFQGWRKVTRPRSWDQVASELGRMHPERVRQLSTLFGDGRALDELRRTAMDDKAEMKIRQAALETLIDSRPDDLRGICESLLGVRFLNGVAVHGLAVFDDPEIAALLVKNYRRFHPDDRLKVLATLVSRPSFAGELLDRMGSGGGQIPPAEVTAFHARQIRSLGDERLNQKLASVWGELREPSADRRKQIAQWREQLTGERVQAADLAAGRALFAKTCAPCHMLFGSGNKIGPDLTGSQRSNLDYLLDNILDPSAVVGKDYRMSVVALDDGRVLNGLVVSRNDKRLVLQTPTNQEAIPADAIEAIRETTQSSMPDELLANLSPDQVRDLVAYLMQPSQVPMP